MKHFRRRLAACAAAALAGLLLFARPEALPVFEPREDQRQLLTIMYHSLVTDDKDADQYVCPVSRVASDLQALRARGYESVTLAQLVAYAGGRGSLPPKPVLITLDDGYRNNLTLLPPLLTQYDMHAVIAVVGEYADIYTRSGEDGSLHSCMSWADVREAAACPRLELACHSYHMHHLGARTGTGRKPGESEDQWRAALEADTRRLLETLEACGIPRPLCYAYPYGRQEPHSDGLMSQLGFQVTLTCNERLSLLQAGDPGCLFSLGRWNRDGRLSTEAFLDRVLG